MYLTLKVEPHSTPILLPWVVPADAAQLFEVPIRKHVIFFGTALQITKPVRTLVTSKLEGC